MDRSTTVSSRWRVMGPLALAATALIPRAARAADPTTPQRTDRTERPVSDDPLTSLLSLVPADAAGSVESGLIATFADMAAQLAAGDIEPPESMEDEDAMRRWVHASYPIALAEPFRSFGKVLDRSMVGFDMIDLDQTLEAGDPPEMVTLLRGRFDRAAIEAAWEAHGYQMVDVAGIQVASLSAEADFDFENEIQQIALARLNNAVFLPDGTLAYASTLPLLGRVLATANGAGDSLAARDDIAATVASLDQPLASAFLVPGESLSIAAQTPIDLATPVAVDLPGEMPPISLAIIGITPGGPTLIYDEGEEPVIEMPSATFVYRLLMAEPGTAADAIDVVDERLNTLQSARTRQPFTELFGSWGMAAVADGDVLALDLLPAEGRPTSIWPQLLFARDLLFLAW